MKLLHLFALVFLAIGAIFYITYQPAHAAPRYYFVDLDISPEEKNACQNMVINDTINLDNHGDNADLESQVVHFCKSWVTRLNKHL